MQHHCRHCGFPFDPGSTSHCPKCDEGADGGSFDQVLEIDVVHNGESWDQAKRMIERGLQTALSGGHKGLRVIHGYGSFSGASIIAPQAISLMRHLAENNDGRFAKDHQNPGVSLVWLNRKRTRDVKAEVPVKQQGKVQPPLGGNWFDQAIKRSR